ncbi:unnamed protein product [Zymoseptoria tritici ST99CH_3D7]|uniref:MARVEL domain-containing protein n=1 Tax=Zymoseptoria tritici (strain ST99CH_3D7) TaxID=1276538 RepID=A0A1X7RS18_ZYMT9|nr:unnamed protein product [Zymoseptoria tritici ST99CH_3D7]
MFSYASTRSKQTQNKHPRFFLLFAANTSLVLLLAILIIAFKVDAQTTYSNATQGGLTHGGTVDLRPDENNDGLRLARYPAVLVGRNDYKAVVASAGLSIAVALSLASLGVFVHRRAIALLLSRLQRLALCFVIGIDCGLSLISFLMCLVHHVQSDHFEPTYRVEYQDDPWLGNKTYSLYGPANVYSGGRFDLTAWACQLSSYGAFEDSGHDMARQCAGGSASLWISLLLLFCNLGTAALLWWDWRGGRVLLRDYRDAFPDEHECDVV